MEKALTYKNEIIQRDIGTSTVESHRETKPKKRKYNVKTKYCTHNGCNKKHHANGLCNMHYKRLQRGVPIDGREEAHTRNPVVFDGPICRIQILNCHGVAASEAIIDTEDYDKAKKYRWRAVHGHIQAVGGTIYLHRLIMDAPRGVLVDHINHDKADNRKKNLRFATNQQNIQNQIAHGRKNNTSGYKGVDYDKKRRKWRARIYLDNKAITLGRFNSRRDAARAYNKAAFKLYGDFASTNNICEMGARP